MISQTHLAALRAALDPSRLFAAMGMGPDAWQRQFLKSDAPATLLCCTRGGGKSRTTSVKALHAAAYRPGSLVLLVSRSRRQSGELFRYVKQAHRALGNAAPAVRDNDDTLELANGSRVVALPGREETVRSFQGVDLLIIDEAARVPDALYHSLRPMLGASGGKVIALSTPFGQRGWFWRAWHGTQEDWHRVRVTWRDCPRLSGRFIERERLACGDSWVAQEYECDFRSTEGLVFPDLRGRCAVKTPAGLTGKPVGGIDFGFRNPFAAVWGVVDEDDVLWLTGEHYAAGLALHDHAAHLPAGVTWYADPSHPTEILGLVKAGFVVRKGGNAIRAGLAAVQARVETGRLRIDPGGCPNLLREAGLYRYDPDRPGETPLDADNHAMAALRYLVSRLDGDFLRRFNRAAPAAADAPALSPQPDAWDKL